MARRKAGEEKTVKFNPCHATHYRNIALKLAKRVADIREGIGSYNGLNDAALVAALDEAEAGALRLTAVLNGMASKKLDLFGEFAEPAPAAVKAVPAEEVTVIAEPGSAASSPTVELVTDFEPASCSTVDSSWQ